MPYVEITTEVWKQKLKLKDIIHLLFNKMYNKPNTTWQLARLACNAPPCLHCLDSHNSQLLPVISSYCQQFLATAHNLLVGWSFVSNSTVSLN